MNQEFFKERLTYWGVQKSNMMRAELKARKLSRGNGRKPEMAEILARDDQRKEEARLAEEAKAKAKAKPKAKAKAKAKPKAKPKVKPSGKPKGAEGEKTPGKRGRAPQPWKWGTEIVCPNCKVTRASSRAEVIKLFGIRNPGGRGERPQSWCRECRREAASGNTTKAREASGLEKSKAMKKRLFGG